MCTQYEGEVTNFGTKQDNKPTYGELAVGEPMQRLTVDIMVVRHQLREGMCVSSIVHITKWAEALPMPGKKASTVAN